MANCFECIEDRKNEIIDRNIRIYEVKCIRLKKLLTDNLITEEIYKKRLELLSEQSPT